MSKIICPKIKDRLSVHVVPGRVRSINDAQEHFIAAPTLAILYRLRPEEWRRCEDQYCRAKVPHLGPRHDGNYERPVAP